jgi:hypothetical protein
VCWDEVNRLTDRPVEHLMKLHSIAGGRLQSVSQSVWTWWPRVIILQVQVCRMYQTETSRCNSCQMDLQQSRAVYILNSTVSYFIPYKLFVAFSNPVSSVICFPSNSSTVINNNRSFVSAATVYFPFPVTCFRYPQGRLYSSWPSFIVYQH